MRGVSPDSGWGAMTWLDLFRVQINKRPLRADFYSNEKKKREEMEKKDKRIWGPWVPSRMHLAEFPVLELAD